MDCHDTLQCIMQHLIPRDRPTDGLSLRLVSVEWRNSADQRVQALVAEFLFDFVRALRTGLAPREFDQAVVMRFVLPAMRRTVDALAARGIDIGGVERTVLATGEP